MVKLSVLAIAAFVTMVAAEPPVGGGYSYHQPSSVVLIGGGGGGHGGHGGISLGGGFSLGGHGGGYALGGGGGYRAVHSGYQTSEGQYVDPHLLEEIKNIILKDEIQNSQYSSSSSFGHGLSGSYGAPSPVYGVPHHHERVVGIEFGHVKQGIQVAQYEQDGGYSGGGGYAGGFGGYSSGGHSGGYSLGGGHSGGYSLGGGHSGGFSLGGGIIDGGYSSGGHGVSLSSEYSAPSGGNYHTISVPAGTYGVPLPSHHH